MSVDLRKVKTVYFIGIKGVAMTGLAVICKNRAMEVFGSDVSEKFITDKILTEYAITVFEEFSVKNFDVHPDLVVVGTSWDNSNVEVAEAKKRELPCITDSQLRGLLSQEKKTIAITGVHGKTTTTAMMAHVFTKAGLDPSYLIGTGAVPDLGANAAWRSGKHFIVEGDEYIGDHEKRQPKFLDLASSVSVITSVEWEHVDVYPTLESIEQAFKQLVDQTKETIIACGDWDSIKKITAGKRNVITYGFHEGNTYQAYDLEEGFDDTLFKVKKDGDFFGEFELKIFGQHNVLNALAVIIAAVTEGISEHMVRSALATFSGAERRFDVSERNNIIFIDDYAHHPTEIATTLAAIRHRYKDKKIWCVFQPHMVSRTKALVDQFTTSFNDADMVLFADIFASAREQAEDFTSKELAEKTKAHHPDVRYVGDLNETLDYLKKEMKPGMVLVTMGAGDVYRIRDKMME